ncbi:hypothetical protein EV426DRAFT_646436 [Tirmania nivea]|nr:hypothetical protein EV426DRAFT_646436 [Tirmania nivea]
MGRRPGPLAAASAAAVQRNIEWDLPTEEWLARCLVANWQAWEKGPKIDLYRHWVEELKLKELIAELSLRAPRKLGVPVVSDSDEKEEPDDNEAGRQKKGTKKKKSGTKLGLEDLVNAWGEDNKVKAYRIETAKLKWSAKMLEYSPTEREKDRARMMMEKAQFVLTHRITPEDFFEKLKSGNFVPIATGTTFVKKTPAPAPAPAPTPKVNAQAPQKAQSSTSSRLFRRSAITLPESNSEENDNLVTEDEEFDLDS